MPSARVNRSDLSARIAADSAHRWASTLRLNYFGVANSSNQTNFRVANKKLLERGARALTP